MIEVKTGAGSYPVRFLTGEEAMSRLPQNCVVVTDSNVDRYWGHTFPEVPKFELPPGEASKSLLWYGEILEWMAKRGCSRTTTVVAVGGGVVGDLAGFVAATYMRGVPLIQVPTTLLSQVDSSVGGKVGIDLHSGKNLAGAFHQPQEVSVAVEYLTTLDERQMRNGMAEVWKYGFIADPALLDVLREPRRDWQSIVERCIRIKAATVEEDEYDRTGRRAILNFGHTVGHALEALGGYSELLHGEAISIGMTVEAKLGERLGVTSIGIAAEVEQCLANEGLPTTSEHLQKREELIELMLRDKKAEGGELAFSLLTELGTCKLVKGVPRGELEAVLQAV